MQALGAAMPTQVLGMRRMMVVGPQYSVFCCDSLVRSDVLFVQYVCWSLVRCSALEVRDFNMNWTAAKRVPNSQPFEVLLPSTLKKKNPKNIFGSSNWALQCRPLHARQRSRPDPARVQVPSVNASMHASIRHQVRHLPRSLLVRHADSAATLAAIAATAGASAVPATAV
jgi:hypothetical protein